MKKFKLILSGPAGSPAEEARANYHAAVHGDNPALILHDLRTSLAALDRADAGIAAAYLAMAIDSLCDQFNLAGDISGTD